MLLNILTLKMVLITLFIIFPIFILIISFRFLLGRPYELFGYTSNKNTFRIFSNFEPLPSHFSSFFSFVSLFLSLFFILLFFSSSHLRILTHFPLPTFYVTLFHKRMYFIAFNVIGIHILNLYTST